MKYRYILHMYSTVCTRRPKGVDFAGGTKINFSNISKQAALLTVIRYTALLSTESVLVVV